MPALPSRLTARRWLARRMLARRPTARRLLAPGVLALTLLPVLAGPAAASGPPGVSDRQERVVLGLVDAICGDTWCEGDYAFDFRRLHCDAAERTCALTLRIARYDSDPLVWRWRTRELHGFVRFRQMVVTSPSGQRSLTPEFYSAVNDLVQRVEASVPAP